MKRTITVILTVLVMCSALAPVYALDPELAPRLGIPVNPNDLGETYGDDKGLLSGGLNLSLGSCGDLGIDNSLTNLVGLVYSSVSNAQNLSGSLAMAALAYYLPTEYSAVTNIFAMAQKYLSIFSEKCKTYQEARKYLEKKDISGIRSAAYAKCLEKYGATMGDSVDSVCSNPQTAWQALTGTSECLSVVENALANVNKLPAGMTKETFKYVFGDAKICATNNSAVSPSLTMSSMYSSNKSYYSSKVESAVSSAKSKYHTQDDIANSGLCVGAAADGSNKGIICPSAETLYMLSKLPSDEQSLYKQRLIEDLSVYSMVYQVYGMSAIMHKGFNANSKVAGIDSESVSKLTDAKEKEVNAFVNTLKLAKGADGDLRTWENEVMRRYNYWKDYNQKVNTANSYNDRVYGRDSTKKSDSLKKAVTSDMKNNYYKD
ncbi:MAG: hypothetical protein K8I29_01840 [Alphaproteobacteria bacterium]|uniref:Uncharacterized protein n=1 Tax=Candidatus Nitrobium versatile TaxID=2884831 RepID=A0A953LYZ7_9BACT|nr:hypothetical protein [Candidatus Nitrobium versatile]